MKSVESTWTHFPRIILWWAEGQYNDLLPSQPPSLQFEKEANIWARDNYPVVAAELGQWPINPYQTF